MNDKNFLNLHILISHSPSCLNRDDMNMQKSAVFGGVRRVRISSQSLKRAMRESTYYIAHLFHHSIRTREINRLAVSFSKKLVEKYDENLVATTIKLIAGSIGAESDGSEDAKGQAVAPWLLEEVERYCELVVKNRQVVDEAIEAIAKEKDKEKRNKKYRSLHEKLITKDQLKALRQTLEHGVDIALFGRMATSGLMTSVDGAMAVAHAITTHAVDADIDWFTAVDDLTSEEGETGAGHLNTQEFSSGVFYRYASLNLGQLQKNLGDADRTRALEVAAHLAHLLATVVPSAKQQTFAAHNLADLVIASFSDQPISLANAFESPVKAKGGLLKPSCDALLDYWKKITDAYSLEDRTVIFSTQEVKVQPVLSRLADLENWILADGQG